MKNRESMGKVASRSSWRYSAACYLLLMQSLAAFAGAEPPAAPPPPAETLFLFDPRVPETPESIVIDRSDNAYISLALTGEIRKISPSGAVSTLASMPIGAPCGTQATLTLGLAIDHRDRLYVAVTACDPTNHGLWRVDTDNGAIELLANAPSHVIWNGIVVHNGFVYAADTWGGLLWRIPANGGVAEIWADFPLLKPPPDSEFPGPNGVGYFQREIYVANSATGDILAIPIEADGSAGEPRVHATLPDGSGGDEFAFDVHGSIYCTTDPFNTVVRLDPDGTSQILLNADDLLDGPTSVAFGRRGGNRHNLYITNAAFPFFPRIFRPSLMRLRLNVPGAR